MRAIQNGTVSTSRCDRAAEWRHARTPYGCRRVRGKPVDARGPRAVDPRVDRDGRSPSRSTIRSTPSGLAASARSRARVERGLRGTARARFSPTAPDTWPCRARVGADALAQRPSERRRVQQVVVDLEREAQHAPACSSSGRRCARPRRRRARRARSRRPSARRSCARGCRARPRRARAGPRPRGRAPARRPAAAGARARASRRTASTHARVRHAARRAGASAPRTRTPAARRRPGCPSASPNFLCVVSRPRR